MNSPSLPDKSHLRREDRLHKKRDNNPRWSGGRKMGVLERQRRENLPNQGASLEVYREEEGTGPWCLTKSQVQNTWTQIHFKTKAFGASSIPSLGLSILKQKLRKFYY